MSNKTEPTKINIHQNAASRAKQYLKEKYRDEYKAKYREFVIEMGGRVHPTKAERIANLKRQIQELESRGV
jgi:hypothetical protein